MGIWTRLKRLFKKSKPALCWIDHFSGVKAVCWVQISESEGIAVKAVFEADNLKHLVAGDAFLYDFETKRFSDVASDEEERLAIKKELDRLNGEHDELVKQDAIRRAFETGNIVVGNKDENGKWDIKELKQ